MRRFLLTAALLFGLVPPALGQVGPGPGPGPVPSPWIVNGNAISYGGSVLDPVTVPGGAKGPGTFNVSGGYYVNGVLVSGMPFTPQGDLLCNLNSGSLVPTPCSWTQFASLAIGTTTGMIPYYNGTAWATITPGTSVVVPGTGTLESVQPVQTVTGASKTFGTADLFKETERSNSGSAMTDTFPAAATTGLISGTRIVYDNTDATASATISAGSGTTMPGGIATDTVGPGRSVAYVYNAVATQWVRSYNTGTALLGPNNLSDLSNIVTARNTLIPSGTITNAQLVNASTNVNGQTCTLGGSCTITASAGTITVGTTNIQSGTAGFVLMDAAGTPDVLGEYAITGSGNVVMSAGATFGTATVTASSITGTTAFGIRSSGTGAFDLQIANTENLTANRTLTIAVTDASETLKLNGNVTFGNTFTTGGNALTLTTTAATNVTFPTTGTLATLAGTETLTGKTINGSNNTLTNIANASLINSSTTVNGQTCTLGGSCTVQGVATQITVGTTTVSGGSANGLLYDNGGVVGNLATANNGVLITSGSGVPSISSTLPSGIAATNMNLTTPTLGVASATSINKVAFTAPATGSTLAIADGKTLTASNSLTLAGTDSTTMTFPSTSATIAALNLQNQTLTGGANVTSVSLTTGSITVNCGLGPSQKITGSTSAWSITAPANDGSCMILLTNAASSPAIPTFSGFTVGANTGSPITSVGGSEFTIQVWRINGVSGYSIFAHQ